MKSDDDKKGSTSKPSTKDDKQRYTGSKEALSTKYAAIREQSKSANVKPVESMASAKVSLLDADKSHTSNNTASSGLASKWASMKQGFQTFKANVEAKKFLPVRQVQEPNLLTRDASSESLDEIFQRLKRPSADREDDDSDSEIKASGRKR